MSVCKLLDTTVSPHRRGPVDRVLAVEKWVH